MNRRQLFAGTIALAAVSCLGAQRSTAHARFVTDNWFNRSFMLEDPAENAKLKRHLTGMAVKVYPERILYEYHSHDATMITWERAADQSRLDYNYITSV